MAKYTVLKDGTTLLHVIGTQQTEKFGPVEEYESRLYQAGDEVDDSDLAPHVVEAFDNGDEHVRSLIEKAGSKSSKKDEEPKAEPKAEKKSSESGRDS